MRLGYVYCPVPALRVATPCLALALCAACKPAAHDATPPPDAVETAPRVPVQPSAEIASSPTRAEPVGMIELCAARSSALADARAQYEALEQLVEQLADTDPATEFGNQAKALYRHECLAVGRRDEPFLDLDLATGVEAKTFWLAGLDMWFRTYLDSADGSDETVWLLPTRRDVVTAQTRPEDPRAAWMCSADPEDPCAQEVAPWRSRAERYFELWTRSAMPDEPDCREVAKAAPPRNAYAVWRACEDDQLARHPALPVGGLGLIDHGWMFVYGRRGHYEYCDEVAALDLSSGAYYRFADCAHRPEMAELAKAAGVAAPGNVVETGNVPLELLREFVWMALSVPDVQRNVVLDNALGRQLPAGVKLVRSDEPLEGTGSMRLIGSSGNTTLGWVWSRGKNDSPGHGQISWPNGLSDPADDHTVRLMSLAERRSVPGCAAAKLPRWVLDNLAADALPNADDELVDPPSDALLDTIRAQLKQGRCAR